MRIVRVPATVIDGETFHVPLTSLGLLCAALALANVLHASGTVGLTALEFIGK